VIAIIAVLSHIRIPLPIIYVLLLFPASRGYHCPMIIGHVSIRYDQDMYARTIAYASSLSMIDMYIYGFIKRVKHFVTGVYRNK